ncbi:hypothetical protein B0H17DRAFT_1209229 [Mycena rosella]|uniref:Uncharacterized protein n=1 Tax=Mycena rosella TaxID=1033263 RepID=A0AAD7G5Z5_MYCRO|nr:hypothetical protein B0H17DRAFT_1209229 [Mycena rosella]
MSFISVTNAYRRVAALSLLQLTSGLSTIYIYGLHGSAGTFQLVLSLYAAVTVVIMYRLLSHTRFTSAHIISRVQGQYYSLLYFAHWFFFVVCSTTAAGVLSEPRWACLAERFDSPQCMVLGVDMVLPYAIIAALYLAARALRRCAIAIHGTELITIQGTSLVTILPPPAGAPAAKLIPAWTTPHMADLRRACEERGQKMDLV